ncbi:MAG: glycine cleavage system aminomethyltransferase GcvT, partial [Nitrospinota bacterium]
MVPFAGFEMPVQYDGVVAEHRVVRSAAGLFDVSHMGEFYVEGPRAEAFLQRVTTNDVSKLEAGRVQYSTMCYPEGGVVDDLTVFRLGESRYLLIVNAANIEKDFQWLLAHAEEGAALTNASEETALLALQGPRAEAILSRLTPFDPSRLAYYWSAEMGVAGERCLVSRTGYTGEDGFEVCTPGRAAPALWRALREAGASEGLRPAGLGARDTLRTEMKYALYGNDITAETTPLEAGLGWVVMFKKGDFIGRAS